MYRSRFPIATTPTEAEVHRLEFSSLRCLAEGAHVSRCTAEIPTEFSTASGPSVAVKEASLRSCDHVAKLLTNILSISTPVRSNRRHQREAVAHCSVDEQTSLYRWVSAQDETTSSCSHAAAVSYGPSYTRAVLHRRWLPPSGNSQAHPFHVSTLSLRALVDAFKSLHG